MPPSFTTHNRNTEQLSISLTPELAAKVRRQAEAEGRTISELFRDCYRTYREKQIKDIFGKSAGVFQQWAKNKGLSDEQAQAEVEQMIDEEIHAARKERRGRASQKVYRTG